MSKHKNKIVYVEDELETANIVKDYLEQAHYSVELFSTGDGVVERIRAESPNLVLLDVMLPGMGGSEICRSVRSFSTVPIIMITAKGEEFDRLVGYELGADDYICKPVNPREILARVKAVLRRTRSSSGNANENLIVDAPRHLAMYRGTRLDLTPTEFHVLELLYSGEGRIFSREEIIEKVYSDPSEASKRAVDTCIKKLRRKFAAVTGDADPIRSVYGVGYKYEED